MLTGRRAFQRETAAETMTAILKEDVPEPQASGRQLPPALDRLVRRCLEKNEEERLQSARDLAIALEAISGSDSSAVAAQGSPLRARRLAGAAGLLLAGALLGFLAAQRVGLRGREVAPRELPRYNLLTSRRGSVFGARFAADGNTAVYSAIWDSEPLRVFATRLDGPRADAPPLVDASLLALSRSGELAVSTRPSLEHLLVRGTLAQLPLAGGTPRELLENVTAADWSPDGRLAAVRVAQGRTRLEFPAGTVLYETAGWLSSPRFSPAGDAIAFHEHPIHGDDRGWPALVDVATRAKRNLTPEIGTLSGLAWRSDASEVCFASGSSVLCVARAGGPPRRVLRSHTRAELCDIAPDGRLLLRTYSIRGALRASAGGPERDLSWLQFSIPMDVDGAGRVLFETLDYGVYLRGLDMRPPVRLGEGIPTGLSPDGGSVLDIVPGDPTRLQLIPTGAGETRTLPSGPVAHHSWAAFMPDGRRIVVSGAEPGKGSRLFLQDTSGGEPRPISGEGVRLAPYVARVVSPDGRYVTALGPDGEAALYPIEGGEPRKVPGLGDDLAPLSFSERPDVLFARSRRSERTVAVYRVDLTTGQRRLSKNLSIADPSGAPSIDLVTVSTDGKAYAYCEVRTDAELYLVSGVF